MGRKVKPRVSYRADGVYLSRLVIAIEQDERKSSEWRTSMIGHLNALIQAFLLDTGNR